MTSTVSGNMAVPEMAVPKKSKGYSPVLHYWKNGVRSNGRMMVIITVLHLISVPPVLLSLIIGAYQGSYDTETFAETFFTIGIFATLLAGFLGIFVALNSFNCLHKRSVVDMKLSLPLTSTQRFFADFLSGLFVYLVPFLIADVISLLLAGYGLAFMEGKTFHHILKVKEAGVVHDSTYVCEYFSEAMPALLKLTVCGILAMLMLYTITVLITVCCGSIFESIIYTLLVNVVIPGTISLTLYNIYGGLYGISIDDSLLNPVAFTSVAGGFFYLSEWVADGGFQYSGLFQPWLWATLFLLMTLIYGAAAFFLYRKRRAEQVTKPFVFKLAYYIIITGAMLCIYSIYYVTETNMVSMVIITAVSYMIFEVITNRGFRRFWLSIIKYAATMLAAVAIVFAGQKSEGFGAVQEIPSLSSISSVSLRYDGFYGDFAPTSCEYTNPENMQTIIDIHSAIVNNYNEHKQDYVHIDDYYSYVRNTATSGAYIYINYSLKNGRTLKRHYSNLNWETTELLSKIDLTDEFKTQTAARYKENILAVSKDIAARIAKDPDIEYNDYERNCYFQNTIIHEDAENMSTMSLYRKGFYEQLAEAYSDDIMSINEENYYHSPLRNKYHLSISSFYGWPAESLEIPESFSNTLGVLERFGFNIIRVEDLSDEEIAENLIKAVANGYLRLYDENQWRELLNVPEGEVLHSAYDRYNIYSETDSRVYLYTLDGNICDLIRAAMPRNIIGSGCYTISVFDNTAGIPQELTPLAETVAGNRTEKNPVLERQYREIADRDLQ